VFFVVIGYIDYCGFTCTTLNLRYTIFRFVPYKPGRYTVDVRCGGESIENSPFVMRISEAETVSVKLKEFEKQVWRVPIPPSLE